MLVCAEKTEQHTFLLVYINRTMQTIARELRRNQTSSNVQKEKMTK